MRKVAWAFVLIVLATGASAEVTTGQPIALYKRGDYAGAVRAGLAENTEAGFDVAARAALAEETLRDSPCLECLKRAESYARRAIAAGGKEPESYVYLAAALGHESRIIGVIRARLADYPAQAKSALDTAYSLNPGFSWTLAALGGWNIEVVRMGGSWLGDLMFDASVDKGNGFFHRAIAADPKNVVIHFQFALALAAYDLDGERGIDRERACGRRRTARRTSAYDVAIKGRARGLVNLLTKGEDEMLLALVHKYQGYPP